MKFLLLIFFLPLPFLAAQTVEESVVKIFATVKEPDYSKPWSSPSTHKVVGSGFIIEGNRILTNAHVVAGATFIEVHTGANQKKFESRIQVLGSDCDLAVLEVVQPNFFEGKLPLPLAEELLPREESVQVYGFPVGGKEISVTKGIVSRVDLMPYVHSGKELLVSQIDAPINPGNSGGPVLADGKVVGVAHQGNAAGQNIGYMIPAPIIHHFLQESSQEYQGFPCNPFFYQKMENQGLRQFYGLVEEEGGVLVTEVPDHHFFKGLLRFGDILLKIDEFPISATGTVFFEHASLSLPFQSVILTKNFGDPIVLTVLREGKRVEVEGIIDGAERKRSLAPYNGPEQEPSYYIYGGCVFQPLSWNLVNSSVGKNIDFLPYVLNPWKKDDRKEIVVLTSILDDRANAGYKDLERVIIEKVNEKKVVDLKDLIRIIEEVHDPFIVFTTSDDSRIVLSRELVQQRTRNILKRYSIRKDRSDDLT